MYLRFNSASGNKIVTIQQWFPTFIGLGPLLVLLEGMRGHNAIFAKKLQQMQYMKDRRLPYFFALA